MPFSSCEHWGLLPFGSGKNPLKVNSLLGLSLAIGCPNWAADAPCHPFALAGFKPTGEFPPQNIANQVPAITFDANELHVKGFRLDKIASILPVYSPHTDLDPRDPDTGTDAAVDFYLWEEECLETAKEVYDHLDEESVLEKHWMTLVGGEIRSHPDSPYAGMSYESFYKSWKLTMMIMATEAEQILPKHVELLGEHVGRFSVYNQKMGMVMGGRRYVSTTGGRIGVVAGGVELGDSVVAIYGAGPLYLLRFGEDGKASLVGDAYIHDLMEEDEAFACTDRGVDETFVLI